MRIDSKVAGETLYIGFCGELDEYAASFARSKLDALCGTVGIKRVVMDMSELAFMDSTGIGVLIGRFKKLQNRDVSMFISSPTSQVDRVLRISGIYNIIPKA